MRFLRGCVDLRDWGVRDRDGRPKSQYTNEMLWQVIDGLRRPLTLTRGWADKHLVGEETVYYRSCRRADTALLMIDVDAHHGQTDAWDAAELLLHLCFPGQYVEESTNRRGYHIYVRVELAGSRRQFNRRLAVLQNALGHLLVDHNLASTVEVKGACTLLRYDFVADEELTWLEKQGHVNTSAGRWRRARKADMPGGLFWRVPTGIWHRPPLAKLPRLSNGLDALAKLESSPVLSTVDIKGIADLAYMGGDWATSATQDVPLLDQDQLQVRLTRLLGSDVAVAVAPAAGLRPTGKSGYTHTGCISHASPDALVRTRTAAFRLARQLARVPTLDELQDFYAANGYAHGAADVDRAQRMRSVLKFLDEVFDPNFAWPGFQSRLRDLLEAINAHVTPEHHNGSGYDRRIADGELAVLMYVVERGSFDRSQPARLLWTLPLESVTAMAATLRAGGCDCGTWPPNKFYAAKKVLERAGLITRFDDAYSPRGKHGVAQRYYIGPNAPLFAAFADHCSQDHPQVLRVNGNRLLVSRPYDGNTTEVISEIPARIYVSPHGLGRSCAAPRRTVS